MRHFQLGRRGLWVSEIGLGTLTWGRDTEVPEAAQMLDLFLEAGGSVVESSPTYGGGAGEVALGEVLAAEGLRDEAVIVSRAGTSVRGGRQRADVSRGALLDSLDSSLANLGTDRVDIWIASGPDGVTALEETVGALVHALDTGKCRYVGLSNYPGWMVGQAAQMLRDSGHCLGAVEMEYSLLNRGVERDVLPAAQGVGAGFIAWSALGRGVLTGKYRHSLPADSRAAAKHLAGFVKPYLTDWANGYVDAVATAAEGLDSDVLEVALAWVRGAPGVSSALVGPRNAQQLRKIIQALDFELRDEIREALDDVTAPHFSYPDAALLPQNH